jgi:hypothetical protein
LGFQLPPMEVYESIAWIAIGFIPTLLAMETGYHLARGYNLRKGKETPLTVKMLGVENR